MKWRRSSNGNGKLCGLGIFPNVAPFIRLTLSVLRSAPPRSQGNCDRANFSQFPATREATTEDCNWHLWKIQKFGGEEELRTDSALRLTHRIRLLFRDKHPLCWAVAVFALSKEKGTGTGAKINCGNSSNGGSCSERHGDEMHTFWNVNFGRSVEGNCFW